MERVLEARSGRDNAWLAETFAAAGVDRDPGARLLAEIGDDRTASLPAGDSGPAGSAPITHPRTRSGSTDEDRVRHLTVALPPRHAARLFEAQEHGASDDRLREIAAEALKETYFQDGGRRVGSLEEVHFTDIEHLEFDL